MQSLHKNAFNKHNGISEFSPAYFRCAQNSYIIGTYPHHKSRSICNCFPLFFSPEAGETDGHFVDVIEQKNKNTISHLPLQKITLTTLQTIEYQLFTLMIAWLAGNCSLLQLPSITKEDHTAYC